MYVSLPIFRRKIEKYISSKKLFKEWVQWVLEYNNQIANLKLIRSCTPRSRPPIHVLQSPLILDWSSILHKYNTPILDLWPIPSNHWLWSQIQSTIEFPLVISPLMIFPNRNQTRTTKISWSSNVIFNSLNETILMNIEEGEWFLVWLCPHNDSLWKTH
jgi:hypothetical protein